jgi:hypothetical protein
MRSPGFQPALLDRFLFRNLSDWRLGVEFSGGSIGLEQHGLEWQFIIAM